MRDRSLLDRASRLSVWQADVPLAVVLALVLVGIRWFEAHRVHGGWAGYALTAVAALMVCARRRWPLAVFACTLTLAVLAIALASPTGAISLTVVISVYTLAQQEGRRRAVWLALLGGAALALARGSFQYRGWSDARTAVEPALVLAALFLGWAVSNRRAYVAEIEARAAHAERARAEETRRLLDAERLRIARELHDVLAHGIATINVQAGVAAHVLHDQPDQAAEALRTIKRSSGEAMQELRSILGVLREAGEAEPRAPTPGLSELERLIEATAQAGVQTKLTIHGHRRPLPATVDVAAYRIVQESLTNVVRHAGPASAVVEIFYGDEEMTVSVDDDGGERGPCARTGNGGPPGPAGHGIIGMRERARALGGELEAGRGGDGSFHVRACLPFTVGD